MTTAKHDTSPASCTQTHNQQLAELLGDDPKLVFDFRCVGESRRRQDTNLRSILTRIKGRDVQHRPRLLAKLEETMVTAPLSAAFEKAWEDAVSMYMTQHIYGARRSPEDQFGLLCKLLKLVRVEHIVAHENCRAHILGVAKTALRIGNKELLRKIFAWARREMDANYRAELVDAVAQEFFRLQQLPAPTKTKK